MSLVTVCVVFCMTCWSHSLSCVLQLWHDMSFALFVLCYSYGMIVALFVLCYSNVMTIALFVLTCAAAVMTRHLRVALCPVLHLSYDMTCLSRSFFFILQLWQGDGCLFSSWCLCDMSFPPQAVLCELWSCEEWVQCRGHSWGRWGVRTWWQQRQQGWGNASGSEHTFITPWISVFYGEMLQVFKTPPNRIKIVFFEEMLQVFNSPS